MTEREGYAILSQPYIRIADIARILGVTRNTATKRMTKEGVRRIEKGSYITADFVKKLGLEGYWKQVRRFGNEQQLEKRGKE